MKLEEEQARLAREREVSARQMLVEQEKLNIEEQKLTRFAEIEQKKARILAEAKREQRLIEAKSEAEATERRAQAEANAIKLAAEAEAESIRVRGIAEVEVLKEKSEALKQGSVAAQLQIIEILSQAQVDSAGKIADALGKNNKIMYLPVDNNGGNILTKWLPKMEGLLQSGMLSKFVKQLNTEAPMQIISDKTKKAAKKA